MGKPRTGACLFGMRRCMRKIGLDVGDRTIGIAVSDALGLTAQGVETIRRTSLKDDLARLKTLMDEYETTSLVIGLPKNMDGISIFQNSATQQTMQQ